MFSYFAMMTFCLDSEVSSSVYVDMFNMARGHLLYYEKSFLFSQNSYHFKGYFTILFTNTRHDCTYFNAFSMVISNIATRFKNVDIF